MRAPAVARPHWASEELWAREVQRARADLAGAMAKRADLRRPREIWAALSRIDLGGGRRTWAVVVDDEPCPRCGSERPQGLYAVGAPGAVREVWCSRCLGREGGPEAKRLGRSYWRRDTSRAQRAPKWAPLLALGRVWLLRRRSWDMAPDRRGALYRRVWLASRRLERAARLSMTTADDLALIASGACDQSGEDDARDAEEWAASTGRNRLERAVALLSGPRSRGLMSLSDVRLVATARRLLGSGVSLRPWEERRLFALHMAAALSSDHHLGNGGG